MKNTASRVCSFKSITLKMKTAIILLVLASLSQILAHESPKADVEGSGIFQVTLLDWIVNLGSRECNPFADYINDEGDKALHCLAEIKSNHSFCGTFTNNFEKCTKRVIEVVDSCTRQKDKKLLPAIVTAVVAQVDFICNTDGEHILEMMNPCIFRALRPDKKPCVEDIKKDIRHFINGEVEHVLLSVCQTLSKGKNCFSDVFKDQCLNKITQNTVKELFLSTMKPCRGIVDIK